ncbi:MAG: radical SAM protein [Methanomicrobiales archaeon]|nr:radical SAM protein [Methanomicrobiales archaeon]
MTIEVNANFHTIAGKSVTEREDARYREYRKKWAEWPSKYTTGDFPLHIDLEPTSACNLRCPFCATTHNRYRKGFMAEKTWKAVLDECGENNLYSLKFTYRGEPLLHPDIVRMVAYAKEAGIMDVYFNTNATRLDGDTVRRLIDAGLDRISVSFEGYTPDTYSRYRVGADYETVVANIERIRAIRNELGTERPLVRVQTVLVPELRGHEKEYADFWSQRVDEVAYLDMKDEEDNPDHRGIVDDWACPMLWQRMTVTWDGAILPCVHDIYETLKFGAIGEMTIKEAWNSMQETGYRDLHRTGRAHELYACDRCPLRESEIRKKTG